MYRLVAMDLDGTLFNQHRKITLKSQQAIEALKAKGIFVVIASGRTYPDIEELMRPLGLSTYSRAYFICYNGVIAAQTCPYRVLYQRMIHAEDVRAIARLVEADDMTLHTFARGKVYLSKDIQYVIESDTEMMAKADRIVMSDYAGDDEVYKVLVLDAEEKLDDFRRRIPEEYLQKYKVFKSHSHLLEFVHREGSKGEALSHLCQTLGVLPEEVMAFGDEENDLSMLEFAGMGIAMENAKPALKQVARHITSSNQLDGVAEAIQRFIIKGE